MMVLWLTLNPAHACGGLFCNPAFPVLQSAERVVFGLDEEAGQVEMHVQISYEGPASEFSWVLPVPSEPELTLTTGGLFMALAGVAQPDFRTAVTSEGLCDPPDYDGAPGGDDDDDTNPIEGDVSVQQRQNVGPYDTAILQATSTEALTDWLNDNGYDVPPDLEAALAPYVAEHSSFVALKLASGYDSGDVAPVALRWAGDRLSIPVQLTSVAATPDMPLEAYVLASHRAVPESYLHVQLNYAAVDWWSRGANYPDVVAKAADEAGGHAFATDFAGPTDALAGILTTGTYDRDALLSASGARIWTQLVVDQVPALIPELGAVIEDHVALPDDVTGLQYAACTTCFTVGPDFDILAATDDLEVRVIEPLEVAQAFLDRHAWLTRMSSSLDAAEMTVDPTFVLNADMEQDVARSQISGMASQCSPGHTRDEVLTRMDLPDGRALLLPSANWLWDHRISELQFLHEQGEIAAQIIEQTGSHGEPVVLVDHSEDLLVMAEAHNDWIRVWTRYRGCGCDNTWPAGVASGGLLALVLLLRRRRDP